MLFIFYLEVNLNVFECRKTQECKFKFIIAYFRTIISEIILSLN